MKVFNAYLFLFFGLGLNYVFNVLSARYLGAADFGSYSYALYVFNIFSLVAVCGLDEASLRFLPQSPNSAIEKSVIQMAAILAAGVLFVLFVLADIFVFSAENRAIYFIFALTLPLFVFITVNTAILQAEYIVGPRMAFRYAIEPLLKLAVLYLLLNYTNKLVAPAASLFIALLITNIALVFVFRARLILYGFRFTMEAWTRLVNYILPLFFNNLINILSGRLDVLILGVLSTSTQVGHYAAAFQTSSMIAIVLQGIETVYAPMFSGHIGRKDMSALAIDYQRALRWTMIVSSPAMLLFLLFPNLALLPFGAQYDDATTIFLILCAGQFANLATGSANTILLSMGQTKKVLFNSSVYGLISIAGIYWGYLVWGINGAAMGVVSAFVTVNLLRVYFVYQLTGLLPFSMDYVKILMALSLTMLIGILTVSFMNYLGIIIYPCLFIGLLLLLGLHPHDKLLLQGIVKRISRVRSGQ